MDSVLTVDQYLNGSQLGGSLRLILNVEELLEPGAASLGRLRERVIADRDNGVRVILLSRRPRISFPSPPGSQVLRDAKLVLPPHYPVEPSNASGADSTLGFGGEAIREGVPPELVLVQAIRELGEAACAELDALVFEDDDEPELATMAEPLRDALLSAGMAVSTGDELRWAFNDAWTRVRSALSDVIAGMRTPQPEFAQVSANCWAVERLVKQALRARAMTLWGPSWQAELLTEVLGKTAVSRANKGSHAAAVDLGDLRDPLEWLSLAETLDLRAESEVGSLGVSEAMWKKLQSDLLPVKDRVERSQLMRKNDADVARRWVDLLGKRLSTSGSRSVEETVETAVATQRDLLKELRAQLVENPRFIGDVERDLMSLVVATVRFLAHTLDARPAYTAAISNTNEAPLERVVQDSFKAYLDMSDLAGRSAVEVSGIGGGRADVVLYFNDGTRYVTEVKRELKKGTSAEVEAAYLPQAIAYQSANVPFGQLLILDLTSNRSVEAERLDQSIWVTHKRDDDGAVIASTVVAMVRGNRSAPSDRKT
jgi:hypothetical protein